MRTLTSVFKYLPPSPQGHKRVMRLGGLIGDMGSADFPKPNWCNLPCPHNDVPVSGHTGPWNWEALSAVNQKWGDWKCAAISVKQLLLWWEYEYIVDSLCPDNNYGRLYIYDVPEDKVLQLATQVIYCPHAAIRVH